MYVEKHSERDRYSKRLADIIVGQFTLIILKNIIISLNSIFTPLNGIANLIIVLYVFINYFLLILQFKHCFFVYKEQVIIIIFIILLLIHSLFIYNNLLDYNWFVSDFRDFLVYSLPLIIFLPSMKNPKYFLEKFQKMSYIMIYVLFASAFLKSITPSTNLNAFTSYSMSFGRNAVIPAVFMFSRYFKSNLKKDLILAILSSFIIIMFGSRFPILILSFFIIIKLFQKMKISMFITLSSFSTIILMILYKYSIEISTSLYNLLLRFNINSRTIYLMTLSRGAKDSGRSEIHRKLITELRQSPYFGYGLGSSNVLMDDWLAHSLIIDTLVTMGYIVGVVFIIIIALYTISSLFRAIDESYRELLLISLSLYLPISNLQLSLLTANMLWFSIMICISIHKEEKNEKN